MQWFFDHYADPADRSDPRASPLRAAAWPGCRRPAIVTCEFDPLRDEGVAYAKALAAVPACRSSTSPGAATRTPR
jgi:acetyl esterase/lipase